MQIVHHVHNYESTVLASHCFVYTGQCSVQIVHCIHNYCTLLCESLLYVHSTVLCTNKLYIVICTLILVEHHCVCASHCFVHIYDSALVQMMHLQ